jgi:hypothetical protein
MMEAMLSSEKLIFTISTRRNIQKDGFCKKVPVLSPYEIIDFFNLPYLSKFAIGLRVTQPLTQMSTERTFQRSAPNTNEYGENFPAVKYRRRAKGLAAIYKLVF